MKTPPEIKTIVQLLKDDNLPPGARTLPALTTAKLAGDPLTAEILVQEGAPSALLKLLANGQSAERSQAAFAIACFIEHPHVRASWKEANCVKILVAALSPENPPEARGYSAFALGRLAQDDTTRQEVLQTSIVRPLASLLTVKHVKLVEWASYALSNIFADGVGEHLKHDVFRSKVVSYLIALLGSGDPTVQGQAASALAGLASTDFECRELIVNSGAIKPLVSQLEGGTLFSKSLAAHALGRIAQEVTFREEAMRAGSVDLLINLLTEINGKAPQVGVLVRTALTNILGRKSESKS